MRKYLVVYEKAGKNCSAYVPDLPGCIATDKTLRETEKNIRQAITFHIKGLEEDGIVIPRQKAYSEYVAV